MKTNQQMEIKINEDLFLTIGHKTKLGKLDNVLTHGNHLREQRGLKPIELRDILRKQDFWEFIIALNTHIYRENQSGDSPVWIESDYSVLSEYKKTNGQIDYIKLMKQFPHLIKSQRGGKVENRGYWAELTVLLKIASMLDKDLEVQIYRLFIKENILQIRDNGGESFKVINQQINKLPDFNEEKDKYYYSEIARLIRHKVFNLSSYKKYKNIWNDEIATSKKLNERDNLISKYSMLIEEGYITSYYQLWLKLGGDNPIIKNFILGR